MTPTVVASAGSYSRLAPGAVEEGEEGAGAGDAGTPLAGPARELPVRCDELDAAATHGRQVLDDAVVSRIPARPPAVTDGHPGVLALGEVGLGDVEHHHDRVVDQGGVALHPRQQAAGGRGPVPPPTIGAGTHDVVAVDDEGEGITRAGRCGRGLGAEVKDINQCKQNLCETLIETGTT